MSIWEIAILGSITSKGGRATTREIYEELESGKFIHLTEDHFKIQAGRPAYRNQTRSHLINLKQAKDILQVSRGVYQLTTKGRGRLKRV